MHKDIELTKMDNAYLELASQVGKLFEEHVKKYGPKYSAYAMRELAIETSARHMMTLPALAPNQEVIEQLGEEFSYCVDQRLQSLLEEAVKKGIIKAREQ